MDDKSEAFAEWLLGDIFSSLIEATAVKTRIPAQLEGERCVPETFHREMFDFSREFIDKLMSDITCMPVLLMFSENLFKLFTKSVCLKLINNVHPEVGFLKVMAFLYLLASMSFLFRCFRFVDNMPAIFQKLLKEHIKTKFYEEDRFYAISSLCEQLKADRKWCESFVEEMRTSMNDSIKTEFAAPIVRQDAFELDDYRISIIKLRRKPNLLIPNENFCHYCYWTCTSSLKAFFEPKIMYRPWVQRM